MSRRRCRRSDPAATELRPKTPSPIFLLFLKNKPVTDSLSLRGSDDGCTSNETLVSGHGCDDRDIYRCGSRATNAVPTANRTAESVSPGRRLADASTEYERRPLGRGHPGSCRCQRQHLGVSSML